MVRIKQLCAVSSSLNIYQRTSRVLRHPCSDIIHFTPHNHPTIVRGVVPANISKTVSFSRRCSDRRLMNYGILASIPPDTHAKSLPLHQRIIHTIGKTGCRSRRWKVKAMGAITRGTMKGLEHLLLPSQPIRLIYWDRFIFLLGSVLCLFMYALSLVYV